MFVDEFEGLVQNFALDVVVVFLLFFVTFRAVVLDLRLLRGRLETSSPEDFEV